MKSLVIYEPARMIGADAITARVLSEDPREGVNVAQLSPNNASLYCSFAATYGVSSVFIGYVFGLRSNDGIRVYGRRQGSANVLLGIVSPASSRRGIVGHGYVNFPYQLIDGLIIEFYGVESVTAANLSVGVVMASYNSFRAEWGHEWGAGRPLDDTSAVERLPSGSFAIDRGIVTSGYQWTFGDLSDEERERLYDIHRAVGRSRSVLVIEDDERTAGLYERTHWGLLTKLDTYSRVDPTATTWGMQVADWL